MFDISPRGNLLVFNAAGEGRRDLFLLDLRNLKVSSVAKTPEYEVGASFSPDGESVIYAARGPSDRVDHLFVRTLTSGVPKQLTAEDVNDYSPRFSPDGSVVVFARDRSSKQGALGSNWNGGGVLRVINADGSGLRKIASDNLIAHDPRFSPDGKSVLFWGLGGLYVVSADGPRTPSLLIAGSGREPAYSPDGRLIAFSTGHFAPDHEIFVCRADGSQLRQLTHLGKPSISPVGAGCFSPGFTADSQRIIFFLESWPDGPTGHPKKSLWEVSVDGGSSREVAGPGLFDDPIGHSSDSGRQGIPKSPKRPGLGP